MADNELVRVAMLESDIVHGDHINIQGINKERKERAKKIYLWPQVTGDDFVVVGCIYRLMQTITNYYRLTQIIIDWYRFLQIITDYYRLLKVITDYYKLLQTITDYNKLLQIITDY